MSIWDAFSGQWEENTGLILLCTTKVRGAKGGLL